MTALQRFQEEQAIGGRVLRFVTRRYPGALEAIETTSADRPAPRRPATVSVVIPCFNYAHYLPAAVGSAVSQRGVEVEVIIVDDRSTDRSVEVADALRRRHASVRVIRNEVNVGHVASFNRGLAESVGEFAVKLDADDLLTPGALARAVALLEARPSVGLVYGHPRHFSSVPPPDGRARHLTWTIWRGADWLAERCRLGVSAITNPEMVLRSTILRSSGAMNPAIPYAPDMELSLRIAALADVGYVGGADQALHREHPASMSETDGSGTLVDLRARRAAFDAALEFVEDEALRARLRSRARRALAHDALRFASAAADHGRPQAHYSDLVTFALDVFPPIAASQSVGRLLDGNATRWLGRTGAIRRRLQRRLRQEAYYSRWMVSGV